MRGVSYVQARVPMSLLQGTATLPTSPMCGASGCACESRVAFLGLCHRHRNARRQWLSLPCRYTEDMAQPIPCLYTDGPTSQSAYASGERNEVQGGPLQRAGNVRDACASSFASSGRPSVGSIHTVQQTSTGTPIHPWVPLWCSKPGVAVLWQICPRRGRGDRGGLRRSFI